MEFVRIGDKVISMEKLQESVKQILSLRSRGLSQSEVAARMNVDRTFISRLESLGEMRKGASLAIIGFPIANCDEIRKLAQEEGVEYVLLMNDVERWKFVKEKNGADLLNEILEIIATVRRYEHVILIGSDKRLELVKALLDKDTEVTSIVIGRSPMIGDVQINPGRLREIIRRVKSL